MLHGTVMNCNSSKMPGLLVFNVLRKTSFTWIGDIFNFYFDQLYSLTGNSSGRPKSTVTAEAIARVRATLDRKCIENKLD